MPSSDRLVAIAAHGLAGSRTDLPAVPLSDVEWFDLGGQPALNGYSALFR